MMAEDIKPEVLKKTQIALNKYIKRPPLTDKLLRKPPFRFLHDIVTSVIKETGYLKDVFTAEELVADNVKDKDSKIKFLTKLISAVKDSTGNNLKAKPGKIVAGLEVDKTLELLQAIAKGIASQTNGNKSVISNQGDNKSIKDVSSSNSTNNKPKPKAEENISQKPGDVKDKKKRERKKEDSKVGSVNDEKEKKKREKSERRENGGKKEKPQSEEKNSNDEKSSKREKTDPEEKQILKEVKKRESFPSEENNIPGPLEVEKSEVHKNQENNVLDTVKEPEKINNERLNENGGISKQPSVESKAEEENTENKEEEIVFRHKEPEQKNQKQNNEIDNHKQSNGEAPLRRPSTRRSSSRSHKQPMKVISEKSDPVKDKEDSKIIEDVNVSTVADKKKSKNDAKDFNAPEVDIIRPPSAIERPRTARRAPPSARPPSVRPGAPKTRDRGEVAVDMNKDKENEAKEVVVIAENEKVEEDKENMVVMEPHHLVLDEESNIEDANSSGAEGLLVDILGSVDGTEKQKQIPHTEIEWEGGQKDKRATWKKECDQLKAGIQALTRSTGPLGKLFDFLQEDVDLAARELLYWKQASAEYTSQLQSEKRSTEELLSKHRKKLTELEGLIEEEQEAIRAVKSSILINDRKILSLISRVPTTQ
ncbi:TRAF3-interacting protein 1 [Halyomorpha halys]|uniref:TRAF3-interacting protein 1 n=1 Tax=Halyomorpha halys TaxID=286706 RepID=UPI0006D4F984|nr:TRAF3-interacting protein 1 isoform X2 [Halyomorpha halys]